MAASESQKDAGALDRPLVVFSLDDQRYALALARVQRSIRVVAITPLPEAPAIVLGIIDLGGVVIPVIDIRKRFNHPPRDVRLSDHLIVATTGKRTVALLVDETKGVIEASPESYAPAGEILPGLELVDGAMKLEDGLILIHDLERLLSLEEETAIDRALSTAAGSDVPVSGGCADEPRAERLAMIAALDRTLLGEVSSFIAERMGLHFPEERWPDLARGLESRRPGAGLRGSRRLRALAQDPGADDPADRDAGQPPDRGRDLLLPGSGELRSARAGDPAAARCETLRSGSDPPLVERRLLHRRRSVLARHHLCPCAAGPPGVERLDSRHRHQPEVPRQGRGGRLLRVVVPRRPRPGFANGSSPPRRTRSFAIDPAVKNLVHFGYLNLAEDVYPSLHNHTNAMDVIFCRNVLMYFTPEHQRRVVAALHRCLVDGGYLLVNPAEASASLFPMFAMENIGGVTLFRKTSQPTRVESWPGPVRRPRRPGRRR